ncbi:MAG: IS66 family transposase [Roseiarcus sp.]
MPNRFAIDLRDLTPAELAGLSHEDLLATACRLLELARSQGNSLSEDSRTSSRPPSSDNPYRREERRHEGEPAADGGETPSASPENSRKPKARAKPSSGRRPGKQPGAKGCWRSQPIVVSQEVEHAPLRCEGCGETLEPEARRRRVGAHISLELARGGMALKIEAIKHVYFAVRCRCGHETVEQPGVGACSRVEGRKRDLTATECCLVGPMLCAFIAALALRFRLSRRKIQEFLDDWLGLQLGTASIDRCIHEFGLASEPVVDKLIEQVQAAEIVHLDETPWHQRGALMWMWVAVTATVIVFRIGSRRKEELAALIGEAFLGWIVSDGYMAYRDHPRRQRCLAHLIRKGLALAEGLYGDGAGFGRDLVRDLRRLIERVRDGEHDAKAIKRLMSAIEWSCQCNRYEIEPKVRELAREILNDWEAIIAFVHDPRLPPTNNDAERALRHAVIARRISFGTRTNEGSRFYAAGLSVIETCRTRRVDPWAYARDLIAAARAGMLPPTIPTRAVA